MNRILRIFDRMNRILGMRSETSLILDVAD
jgi:hypothetical protein